MTVKELKEKLELLIEDGKEDYTVYVEYCSADYVFFINDDEEEVFI